MDDSRPRLTPRQNAIYLFIVAEIHRKGRPPTVRDIGEEFAIGSPNGVVSNLRALEHKGYIRRDKMTARGIEIVGQNDELLTLLREARAHIHPACTTENGIISVRLSAQIKKLESRRRA